MLFVFVFSLSISVIIFQQSYEKASSYVDNNGKHMKDNTALTVIGFQIMLPNLVKRIMSKTNSCWLLTKVNHSEAIQLFPFAV